ncbi:hypothetical protein [Xylanimonas sp. McL0601]|uniref:hypothetical protein n=1 Tax=Xylanimonas sp. McL0601 TaxID=3414739 RepID=UPI003CF02786
MAPADRDRTARGAAPRRQGSGAQGSGAQARSATDGQPRKAAGAQPRKAAVAQSPKSAGSAQRQGAAGPRDRRVVSTNRLQAPRTAAGAPRVRPAPGNRRPAAGRPSSRTAPARRVPVALLVVLGLLVAGGTFLGYGIGRGVGWVREAWPDPVPQLAADKVAPPDAADAGGPSQACPASSLMLRVTPERTLIEPGQGVALDVSITEVGRRPCLVDGGDGSRQVVVSDAEGKAVWTSAHCAGPSRDLLLGPGDVDPQTMRWSGKQSVEGACTAMQPAVGPGTYTVQVVMADVPDGKSDPVTITVAAPPTPTPTPDPAASTEPSAHPSAQSPAATPDADTPSEAPAQQP